MKINEQKKQSFEKFYGFDFPDDFEVDYNCAWCSVDGVIQFLRMDMLPISKRTINAELNYLDGKKEVRGE